MNLLHRPLQLFLFLFVQDFPIPPPSIFSSSLSRPGNGSSTTPSCCCPRSPPPAPVPGPPASAPWGSSLGRCSPACSPPCSSSSAVAARHGSPPLETQMERERTFERNADTVRQSETKRVRKPIRENREERER